MEKMTLKDTVLKLRKYPAHSAAGGSGGTACQTGFLPENRLPA